MMFFIPVFILAGAGVCIAKYSGCPPDGPLLPRPTNLAESAFIRNSTQSLQDLIDGALKGQIQSGFSIENTSFSIGLITHDNPSNRPLWEYHYRGTSNSNGTKSIDGNTQYLIGSISKLISDLLILRSGIDLETPITHYLPQLSNDSSIISWENITLASLADHLSGIPPNFGFSEWYFLNPLLEQLGFPPLSAEDYGRCGIPGLNKACTEDG